MADTIAMNLHDTLTHYQNVLRGATMEPTENPNVQAGQRRFDAHGQSVAIMHHSPTTRRWIVFYPHGGVSSLSTQTIIEMYPLAIDPETVDAA